MMRAEVDPFLSPATVLPPATVVQDAGEHPVILFDGVCNLCNGSVVFIIRRDPRARFRFAALQSEAAESLLASHGVSRDTLPDSMALVEDGRVYLRSAAALRIARGLRFPWRLLYGLILLPRPVRDWMYDVVARHRYRWFGRRDACMIPTAALRERFLVSGIGLPVRGAGGSVI